MKRLVFGLLAILPALFISTNTFDGSAVSSFGGVAQAQAAGAPELPRLYIDTTFPPTPGVTINVPAGGDLQAALNQARPGDQLVLQAGATFIGNYVLPA